MVLERTTALIPSAPMISAFKASPEVKAREGMDSSTDITRGLT